MSDTREKTPADVSRVVGRQIRTVRELLRLSQAQLAQRLKDKGVTMRQVTIARLESGDRRITVDEVFAIAAVLGVSPQLLLSGSFTSELVPVLPELDVTPNDMRFWLGDERQVPGLDEDTYFEIVPDRDRLARRKRSIDQLRRRFVDFREAWQEGDVDGMRVAVSDIRNEIDYQEAALQREERMARNGGRDDAES
jgi:transcriptional regulator with XRE-family HTH domain